MIKTTTKPTLPFCCSQYLMLPLH